jgi:hypothetical protein
MSTQIEKTLSAALALLLATSVAAVARNDQVGQGQWCWVSEHSGVAFCDYSTYGSCQSANRGKRTGHMRAKPRTIIRLAEGHGRVHDAD